MDRSHPAPGPFRVGFASGVTPDKWARRWAARRPRSPLHLVPLGGGDGVAMLRSGELTMCFVRLPVAAEGLHLIPLYDEQPVVVASQAHPVAAFDGIDVADLADEQRLDDTPSSLPDVMDRVAADEGVLVLPLSLARLHHRRDVVHVPVTGVPATTVGLAWRRDAEDDRIETFVGVVRGRTENSSREARPSPGRRRR